MTTAARRIRAVPVRTATETWAFIVDLIGSADETMHRYLEEAGNAAAMLIGEEYTKKSPIILSGCGPQVRIYTLHDAAAIEGTQANEHGLVITATDDWELTLPASGGDFDLVAAAVVSIGHVTVYDPTEVESSTASVSHPETSGRVAIDLSALED